MSTWYYYDNDDQKQGPITGGQLKGLAKTGRITPETKVETEGGKVVPARKVKGLTFIAAAQPETPPASEPTLSELNPFTAAMPVEANPFIAAMPNMMPQNFPLPVTDENGRSFSETVAFMTKWLMNFFASATALILVLVLCGVVGFVLLWLFYLTQPDFVPPGWMEPMLSERQQKESEEKHEATSTPAQTRQCATHMKQIVLALHNYHDAHDALPPLYTVDRNGKPLHSWRVLILPLVEEGEMYKQIRLNEPWDSEYNKQFHDKMPSDYACPGNSGKGCCYSCIAGEGFVPAKAAGQNTLGAIADGTSNTLAIVEVKEPFCWMDPTADITLDELAKGINGAGRVGSFHEKNDTGGINAALFDGSIRFIPQTIDKANLRALGTIDGGEAFRL